jgi:hypothetical protein
MEPDGMAVCPGLCLRTGNCDTAMLAGNRQKLDGKLWEPMLSMVATRRKASKRSGASMPKARQAPLNSSSFESRARISGVMTMLRVMSIAVNIDVNSRKKELISLND